MPVFGEEIEVDSAAGIGGDYVFVERDTEAGSGWKGKVAVFNLGVAWRGLLHVGFGEVVKVLLNLEVGRAGCQMQRGRRRNGTAHVVGRDEHVVGFGPGGQLSLC